MNRNPDLAPLLKTLKLSAMLDTLPERIALARRDQLDYAAFLEIILADEVSRRENRRTETRLNRAGFEETCRLEDFDWTAEITLDRRLLDAAFSLDFIARHEHVLLMGPAGVGKSFLAQALGQEALADAGGTHQEDVFALVQEFQGEGGVQEPSVQGDAGGPVEVLQAADFLEAGPVQAGLDAAVVAAVHLVGEDDLQEGSVVQLLPSGQGDAFGQGGGHGPQLEALEQGREVSGLGHG